MQKNDGRAKKAVIEWSVYVCPHCQVVMQKDCEAVAVENQTVKCSKCSGLVEMTVKA